MREFQERNTTKKRIYSRTSVFLLIVILILVCNGVYGVYAKEQASKAEVERVKKEQTELQARYENIEQGSEGLKSQAGVEAEIRGKFDVVKLGEGVIVVVDKNPTAIQENKQGVLKQFWNSVMGIFGH